MYPQRRMVRQTLRRGLPPTVGVVLLALLLALAVVGCGGGGGQPQQEEAAEQRERNPQPQQEEQTKPRAVPEYGDLRPGMYVTDEFKPAFSFEVVDEGWVVGGAEERGVLDMRQGAEGPVLSFVNEQEVFDPSKLRDMDSVPAPKNLVSWLQRHPYLETEQPQPATIGGVKGISSTRLSPTTYPPRSAGTIALAFSW